MRFTQVWTSHYLLNFPSITTTLASCWLENWLKYETTSFLILEFLWYLLLVVERAIKMLRTVSALYFQLWCPRKEPSTRLNQRDGICRESILEHFLRISKQTPKLLAYVRVIGYSCVLLENQNLVVFFCVLGHLKMSFYYPTSHK